MRKKIWFCACVDRPLGEGRGAQEGDGWQPHIMIFCGRMDRAADEEGGMNRESVEWPL